MKKKYLVLCIGLLIGAVSIHAQQKNMVELFKSMPDSIIPYLSENNRLDLIDFMEAKMEAKVTNLFDGRSLLKSLSADSLILQSSDALTVTMRVLPLTNISDSIAQLICVTRKYHFSEGQEEQVVRFYTPKWALLADSDVPSDVRKQLPHQVLSTLYDYDEKMTNKKPVDY